MVTTEQVAKTDEEFLREVADQIRARMVRVSRDTIGIGRYLIEARARVGSGRFSAWIEAEFKMSRVTAYKMIKVAETFGETGVNQFTPSVLYALIAPDITENVRAEIVGRAESGEKISVADVQALKQEKEQHAYIVEHGVAALVEAVDRDEVSLSAAVVFVRHQQTTQQKLIANAAGSVDKAVTKNNAELKAKADKAAAAAKETPSLFADVKDAAPKPKPDVTSAADRVEQLIDAIEQLERINVSAIVARLSDDEKLTLLAQLARSNTWLNKTANDIAVSGGANLGVLAPESRRFEALEFLRKATARIEAELADRAGAAAS
jgi:hypothetical protein